MRKYAKHLTPNGSFWVLFVILVVLPMLLVGVYSIRAVYIRSHAGNAVAEDSKHRLRALGRGISYLVHNRSFNKYQTVWPDDLVQPGIIDSRMLRSLRETDDDLSFFLAPVPELHDPQSLLIYEDRSHWPERGVLVMFGDFQIRFVPFDDFDRRFAAQSAKLPLPPPIP